MLSILLIGVATAKMILEMSRTLDTCDPHDIPIDSEGTTRMVYAYSDQHPINDVPTKHTQRGTQAIRLASPAILDFNPPETDVVSFDIQFDSFTVPFGDPTTGNFTTYWCGTLLFPTFPEKRQIIRFEPVIRPATNLGTVHHMLLYDCPVDERYAGMTGYCYGDQLPQTLKNCNGGAPIGAWAVGGLGTTYPDYMGYPLEPSTGPRVVFMEIHYNDPTYRQVVDNSGLRFYVTAQLRQYDAGILAVGHQTNSLFSIPAQQQDYVVDSYCPGSCTNQHLPEGGIHIAGVMLHSHMAGTAVNLTYIRNGKELGPILEDKYYDFQFQDMELLANQVTVLPGDTMRVQCTYNTMNRDAATRFGLTIRDEMCLAYAIYYPKLSSEPNCLFANYSQLPGNASAVYGNFVYCFGESEDKVQVDSFTPYEAPPCVRVAPPLGRTSPTIGALADFNSSKYEHNEVLDLENTVKLYWTLDRDAKVIHFATEVDSTVGWMGIGISPTGGMINSDVAMAWVDVNRGNKGVKSFANFSDRFAFAHALPSIDSSQDYFDIVIRPQ